MRAGAYKIGKRQDLTPEICKARLALRGLVKSTEDQLKLLRKQRDAIYAKDLALAERDRRLEEVEEKMKTAVDRFNLAYREAG